MTNSNAPVSIAELPGPFQPRDPVTLTAGDLFVVPAHGLMVERPETLQYGNR